MSNGDIDAARIYHEVTKHSYTSVRSATHILDWNNRPRPFKIYPTATETTLDRELLLPGIPTFTALSGTSGVSDATALDLARLTRLLFCADGITRRKRVGGESYHFRAAASAGALYPIELYLAAAEVEGLEPGLYHFSPADLKLRELRRGDWRELIARAAAMRASLLEARAIVVLSAIFWRSVWKYRARAYRYCFWDAGTILANLIAAANSEGLAAEIITAFDDAPLEALVGVDGEREGIVCLLALGRTAPPSLVRPPEPAPLGLETVALSPHEVSEEDLVKMHRAARLLSSDEAGALAASPSQLRDTLKSDEVVKPSVLKPEAGLGLGETIMRRGSTRVFARASIGANELAAMVGVSSMPLRADFPALTETYLIVNAVEGMEPGAYYYQRESGTFDLLKPGAFRREAGYLCLEQPLGADASALICYMADLERLLSALGNRGYRDAHLEAGLIGGRTYLAAYTLSRGATGLTFYDDDTTRFFGPHAAGKSPILMVAVGVPLPSVQR